MGISVIPSNDFSLYDHMLDLACMVGAIPERFGWDGGPVTLETYFAMARGRLGGHADDCGCGADHRDLAGVPALEMTKWFDTNYHYMVPEFERGQEFRLATLKPLDQFLEARSLGYETRPVLVGPVTFLKLGKAKDGSFEPLALIGDLLPVYIDMLRRLHANGAEWVQVDEPCLALDLTDAEATVLRQTYQAIARALPGLKIMLTSYFGGLGANIDTAFGLPVAGLHIDLARAPDQLDGCSPRRRAGSSCRSASLTAATSGAPISAASSTGWSRWWRAAAPTISRSPPPVRCCMCRST